MSVLDRFPHSTAELKRVKTVQFGVLSPDEIVSLLVFLSLKEMMIWWGKIE
jgi:DNA-directed RNA polymerase II subunit RPB1